MSTHRVEMKKTEIDDYMLLARPCMAISYDAVRDLKDKAEKNNLDFIGIVYENIKLPEGVSFDHIISLKEDPSTVMLVRNIGAGIYKKDFLTEHGILFNENEDALFPDMVVLWKTFVMSDRAMFVSASVCEKVDRDTVWIDDADMAFSVNKGYDCIKNILMDDWELWQKWKGFYSIQRWRCYFELLHWMTEDAGWAFAERMVVDFHRSYELDEIDEMLFTPEERTALYVLAKDPGFVKRFYLGRIIISKKLFDINNEFDSRISKLESAIADKERERQEQVAGLEEQIRLEKLHNDEQIRQLEEKCLAELEQQKNMYESSTTFKVGKIIMFIPVSIKKLIIKLMPGKK